MIFKSTFLFIFYFVIWLLLSGHYDPLLLSLGFVSCLVCLYVTWKANFIDNEGVPLHMLVRLPLYIIWLFKEIIKGRQTKSLNEIDQESKNFSDNEEEMSEIQTIKDLINTSVEDSFKMIDESNEPSVIFDQYPTILQPSPDFLEDDGGETIYSICRDNLNDL